MRNWIIGLVVAACAAPTATLNIWPRVENMLAKGMSGNEIGIVVLVTMSALGMAAVPFAAKKADNWGFWSLCCACGLGLGLVNYLMAVGAIGKARDASADENATAIFAFQARSEELRELKAHRPLVEPKPVTPEMLETAREAVRLAIAARDQECGIVGNFCRSRQVQVGARQQELAELTASAASYSAYRKADERIGWLTNQLITAGAAPRFTDRQATRIAYYLGYDPTPDVVEKVANWIISILAVTAEAFALIMPRIIVTALMRAPSPPIAPAAPAGQTSSANTALARVGGGSVPRKIPAATAKARVLPPANVAQWLTARTHKKPGARWPTQEAFQDYRKWCLLHKFDAQFFSAFRFELQELGVKEEDGRLVDLTKGTALRVVA